MMNATKILRCDACGAEILIPEELVFETIELAASAFRAAHHDCCGTCPKNDPECAGGDHKECRRDEQDMRREPATTLVELMVRCGGDIFESGDGWQDRFDVEDFLRAMVQIAQAVRP